MNPWAYGWIGWLSFFCVWEGVALWRNHSRETMTLTFFMEHHFPRWFFAAFLGWLYWHFTSAAPAVH